MHETFQHLQAQFARELNHRPTESLEQHPNNDPTRWNARQIVEHLILTYQLSGKMFAERLEKNRPTQSQPTVKQRIARLAVLGFGYFPQGIQAPAAVVPLSVPAQPLDGPKLAKSYAQSLQAMDEILVECEQQFGKAPFATHQALGPISPSQWRRFHIVHARHHLSQLRKLNPKR